MAPFDVDPSGRPIPLGRGYALRAPGLAGEGDVFLPVPGGAPVRASAPATPDLEEAFARAHVREAATIALSVRPAPAPPETAALRSPEGDDALELEVPDLGPERAQVVLAVSEDGALTWHFPVADDGVGIETPTVRGAGGVRRFRIPRAVAEPPAGPSEHRGFVGLAGRKLLKVLVYPVTDPILGAVGRHFAARWEERTRPYLVRGFGPDDYTLPVASGLTEEDWRRLAEGPALLFVHGTFSSAHTAFRQIPRELVEELHARYEGRVFAFDAYTLSEDPERNAAWFLDRVPTGIELEVDVVCHSRGGLVARQLERAGGEPDPGRGSLAVRSVVFVGVPNGGTALADPALLVRMIDRMTTAVTLLPSGAVTETLEAILAAVKVIGHGVVDGLPGLTAMRPGGPFLEALNGCGATGARYFAVTADFEPTVGGLRTVVRAGAANAVADRIFEGVANDLVVPTDGVYAVGNAHDFPIPDDRVLRFPADRGVVHTTYFAAPETADALRRWLVPGDDG